MEGPSKEGFPLLGAIYGKEVVKGAQELLKNVIPFRMGAIVSVRIFCSSCIYLGSSCFAYIFVSSMEMSMFSAYMAKSHDRRQYQFSRLSRLREGARTLYNKVQAES